MARCRDLRETKQFLGIDYNSCLLKQSLKKPIGAQGDVFDLSRWHI